MQDYAVHPHRPYVSTAAIDACYLFATREPLPGGSGLHTPADHVGPFEHTYAPVRDLTSVPAARPTMGWHGQAKQPMLQSALSVLAVVTDAQGALPWTEAATRVWVAAVWLRSMWSGSSAQLASKLVWRPPRHGGVAVPGEG